MINPKVRSASPRATGWPEEMMLQAGALGDKLVLGLIPDSEILRCKGPPVMSEAERKTMVESVKWVGEVITGEPTDAYPSITSKSAVWDYLLQGKLQCTPSLAASLQSVAAASFQKICSAFITPWQLRFGFVESLNDCWSAGVPYDLTPQFLEELFTKHNIDYVVHGDDPCLLPDGTDAYAHAKQQGRFRMVSTKLSSEC